MPNPLEFFFSVYLVRSPPFFARLEMEKVILSNRIMLLRYRKSDGTLVLFDVTKRDHSYKLVHHGDNIRAIRFFMPEQDFNSFLMTQDVSNLPHVGWPLTRKNSGPYMRMGGYEWRWEEDGAFLAAYDDASSFVLEYEEARALARAMFDTQT